MPNTRPAGILNYTHEYGALHDRIVADTTPDQDYYSKISNKEKADYICQASNIPPFAFNLDIPLPLEDWVISHDRSRVMSGLYISDLRRQFYGQLISSKPELQNSPAWLEHSQAEYWTHQFNFTLQKQLTGTLVPDGRILH